MIRIQCLRIRSIYEGTKSFLDENELRRILKIDLDIAKRDVKKLMRKGALIIVAALFIGLVLFLLGLHYHSFIPFGIALSLVSFFSLIYLTILFINTRKRFNKISVIYQGFIDKYKNLENVKYIYDSQLIKFLEEEKEQDVFEWQKLESINKDVNSIYLKFSDSDERIWIHKKMTKEEELVEFEKMINSTKKDS